MQAAVYQTWYRHKCLHTADAVPVNVLLHDVLYEALDVLLTDELKQLKHACSIITVAYYTLS